MLDLVLHDPNPPASVREHARHLLAGVLAVHAGLRISDLRPRLEYLVAESRTKHPPRILMAEIAHVESRIARLEKQGLQAAETAERCLCTLLRLLSTGAIRRLEFETKRFAVAVRDPSREDHELQILLLPERVRRFRVQIACLDPSRPHVSVPRCYGELCNFYIDHSLDTGDLATLVLVLVAYLEMN